MSAVLSATTTVAQTQSRVLRIGVLSSIGALDPREAGDTITGLILEQAFEMPYVPGKSGGVEPCLFDEPLRVDREGSAPIYSARVRPGVVFSDGTPLTAELAAHSLSRTKAIRGRAIVTSRDGRVIFTMSGPSPRFENVLTQWNTAIVLEKGGVLYGTGPYQSMPGTSVLSMKRDGVIRMLRNPRYRGKAHADELMFTVFPAETDGTPLRLIEAAKRGEIDVTLSLSANDIAKHGIAGYQAMVEPSNSTSILYFNSDKPHFKDHSLRRAMQHAIDPLRIAEIVYEKNPLAFLAGDIIPPLMGKVSVSTPWRERDLLQKHPGKPSRLTLVVPWSPRPYVLKPIPAANEIARQLSAYGIVVDLIVTKSSEDFFGTLALGQYDMALAGWVADNPDPAEFYESLLSSAQVSTGTQYLSNLSRWRTREMDAALATYRAEPTVQNRAAIVEMIEREAILVPLVYGASTAIRSRKVGNVHITPAGHVAFHEIAL